MVWRNEWPIGLALSPVIAVQGMMLRRVARALPEPPGPRSGRTGRGDPLRLLIVGDSSAAGVGVNHQDLALSGRLLYHLRPYREVDWKLVARSGATTKSVLEMLDRVSPRPVDWVLVGLGVNDVTRMVPLNAWLRQQRRLFDHLRDRFGGPRIIVSGLPPVRHFPLLPQPTRYVIGRRAERFDAARNAMLALRTDTVPLPFDGALTAEVMSPDGYHPGPQIYDRWAELAASVMLLDSPDPATAARLRTDA